MPQLVDGDAVALRDGLHRAVDLGVGHMDADTLGLVVLEGRVDHLLQHLAPQHGRLGHRDALLLHLAAHLDRLGVDLGERDDFLVDDGGDAVHELLGRGGGRRLGGGRAVRRLSGRQGGRRHPGAQHDGQRQGAGGMTQARHHSYLSKTVFSGVGGVTGW